MHSRHEKSEALTAATGRASGEVSQSINKGTIVANSTALTIGGTAVRQVGDLYSLNDLHRAAGGEDRHQPAFFMRREETQALVEEISKSADSQNYAPARSVRGKFGGTYACKEMVIAYAAWISAKFHLKVIRVFLAHSVPQPPEPPQMHLDYGRISPAQAQDLREIVKAIVDAGIQKHAETWARFQRKFRVNSYLQLPVERYEEARQYLIAKLPQGYAPGVVEEPAPTVAWSPERAKLALALVADVMPLVSREIFDSVMTEADWLNSRYLLTFGVDAKGLVPRAIKVDDQAYVAPIERFPQVIGDHFLADPKCLTQIAAICMQRLGRMAERLPTTTPA